MQNINSTPTSPVISRNLVTGRINVMSLPELWAAMEQRGDRLLRHGNNVYISYTEPLPYGIEWALRFWRYIIFEEVRSGRVVLQEFDPYAEGDEESELRCENREGAINE